MSEPAQHILDQLKPVAEAAKEPVPPPVAGYQPAVKYEPHPIMGGIREVVTDYVLNPLMGGTVTIPSASDDPTKGIPLSGFDPSGPQVQIVVDTSNGIQVMGQMTTGGGKMPEAPKPEATAGVHIVKSAEAVADKMFGPPQARQAPSGEFPRLSTQTLPGNGIDPALEMQQMAEEREFFQHQMADQPQRQKLSTSTKPKMAESAKAGKPNWKAEFHLPGMIIPVMYHEIIITGLNLVLIFDRNSDAQQPPEFEPNDASNPFRIKVADYRLTCNFYGQSFVDKLNREYSIFVIDLDNSSGPGLENGKEQPSANG